jgi:hypothetical protein
MIVPKISAELIELFPVDVINTILSYSCNKLIIQLQDYFPQPLKYIMVSSRELELINRHNYQYIRKLDCSDCENITDDNIQACENLTELYCSDCPKITNNSIRHYLLCENLLALNCRGCDEITDDGIQHLVNLMKLDCAGCNKITDMGIQHLVNLILIFSYENINIRLRPMR